MNKTLKTLIIIAAVAAVLAAVLFVAGPGKRPLTASVRAASGSEFIELSEGWTEYELAGPEDGEPVVLVHGLSVPMYDWDFQFEAFAAAGFRVLRYNQYGRGLSDRPRGPWDAARYTGQLKNMMDAMGWEQAHIVVHSMGGAVGSRFAQTHPESVDSLVFIAPVWHMAEDNGGISLIRIPVVGGLAARTILPGILAGRADTLFAGAGLDEGRAAAYSEAFRDQTRYFGFSRSVKSLFRRDMVEELSAAYEAVDGSRALLIWGTRDESVPEAHIEAVRTAVPGMDAVILEGVGHMPNQERPEKVNALVLDFLQRM